MKILLCLSLLFISGICAGAPQNWQKTKAEAESLLRREMAGQKFVLKWEESTPPTLAQCKNLQYGWPPQPRGKIFVTARCLDGNQWSVRFPAWVSQIASIAFIRNTLSREQVISETDIEWREVELASYPEDVLSTPAAVINQVTKQAAQAGQPLRAIMLRGQYVVRQNQTVQILVQNSQFTIKTEGIAKANAMEGEHVSVKTSNGRVLDGIARRGGIVEVSF